MATIRFDIEKFDGVTNFNLWQVQMMEILVQTMEILVQTGLKKVKINDEDQAMLLLYSLPSSYKSFKETLIYDIDKLSFEDMKGHLLSKDKLDNEFGSDSKADWQAFALIASKMQNKRCRYCKKLSHVNADCYKLRNKRAVSNEEDVVGANLADESGDDFLLVLTSDSSELIGVVRMRNDSSNKVIGIGTVEIRMHDGMIRTLSDVKYISYLRKNLISLNILDLKGCRINIESSNIKVSRGALILLKGKRTDSLYILEGSTVIGEMKHPSSVTESKSTRLERRQLGHRKEKVMTILLNRGSLLDAGFEKLGHCVRENQTRVSFDLAVHKSKARSLLAFKHRFDSVNSLHSSR
ncbi:hypothetical protein Gotri_024973 [Gossypium trilobum]|uniref:Retrovirus-related Pol polyprotein from transposon TNT 1-94-like beta-barrel domain-containing protein n=1 Tax=Gossypium trilobum TaxID=34281 RepID=A0A7J9FPC4_9ROSI|nr:hypothetical protein [Gossypium trilobum]